MPHEILRYFRTVAEVASRPVTTFSNDSLSFGPHCNILPDAGRTALRRGGFCLLRFLIHSIQWSPQAVRKIRARSKPKTAVSGELRNTRTTRTLLPLLAQRGEGRGEELKTHRSPRAAWPGRIARHIFRGSLGQIKIRPQDRRTRAAVPAQGHLVQRHRRL